MEDIALLKRRLKGTIIFIFTILIFSVVILIIMNKFVLKKEYYNATDFNIKTIYSKIDYNKNGIDDYSDILLGAKKSLKKDFNEEEFITYSFKYAGYNIKKMIKKYNYNKEESTINNFINYLKNNVKRVSKNISKIEDFQPGDILVFDKKIGIISDKRNKKGNTYIIYYKDKIVEEDIIKNIDIKGHYRFDASLIKDELLA